MNQQQPPPLRTNRSFVIREGRFTSAQKKAWSELWPKYGIPDKELDKIVPNDWFNKSQPVILDIGFGSGDSLISLAQQRPDFNFMGVEVYRPGIGAVLQKIDKQIGPLNLIPYSHLLGGLPFNRRQKNLLASPQNKINKKYYKNRDPS